MAIQYAAVLAAVTAAESFCKIPLVRRFLENWSHKTLNTIDDWVVDALTDSDPTVVVKKLEAAQAMVNKMDPAQLARVQSNAIVISGLPQSSEYDSTC